MCIAPLQSAISGLAGFSIPPSGGSSHGRNGVVARAGRRLRGGRDAYRGQAQAAALFLQPPYQAKPLAPQHHILLELPKAGEVIAMRAAPGPKGSIVLALLVRKC